MGRTAAATLAATKHGDSSRSGNTPEYNAWLNMRGRCLRSTHPRYPEWGGRGITICARWDLFENFLADVGRRPTAAHSLDRVDNDGNYEPGNCRWTTEQQRNMRSTKLSVAAAADIRASSETVSALARRYRVDRRTIRCARDGVTWR